MIWELTGRQMVWEVINEVLFGYKGKEKTKLSCGDF